MFCITVGSSDLCFSALHFAIHPNGDSEALHGHRYRLTVAVHGPLCVDGYVLDFKVLEGIAYQVCKPLDHKILLPRNNRALKIQCNDATITVSHHQRTYSFPLVETKILSLHNTTTELLAHYLAGQIFERLEKLQLRASALELRIEESPGKAATVKLAQPASSRQES